MITSAVSLNGSFHVFIPLPAGDHDVKTNVTASISVASDYSPFVHPWAPNMSRLMEYEAKRSRYLCFRTAQIVLCVLGLVGNCGVILAWTASRRRTPIVVLMTSLALWDLGLLTSFLYYCVRNFRWWHSRANARDYPWSGSLYNMGYDPPMYLAILAFNCFVCTSVFTVLVISFVRYIAVVRPLMVRRVCSRKRMKYLITGIIALAMFLSFCFCLKFMCLSFHEITGSRFCHFVTNHKRAFTYPDFIIIGILPWVGTIPLSALLVVHVTRIPKTRSIRRGSCPASVEYGPRRVTLYVIVMVVLSTVTYPVCLNIFLAMQESPNWTQETKEKLYLTSDFLFIINSIAHIFLFCAGGQFFRSLMYARISYLCTCFCGCVPVVHQIVNRHEDDIVVVDDIRFNVSSTRDAIDIEQRLSLPERHGLEVTRL
ncbi:tachykinin-like peptides receptor 99D [Aplysia californica]|uniref:Tachykinin-like peptides receptor 99D n=1 Tax=Aplysia californica TaxID=6500 RepID=A0ABM1VW05_APLCA|nr:tachykinin-like peptides receptor 99D [Aplysia californica]